MHSEGLKYASGVMLYTSSYLHHVHCIYHCFHTILYRLRYMYIYPATIKTTSLLIYYSSYIWNFFTNSDLSIISKYNLHRKPKIDISYGNKNNLLKSVYLLTFDMSSDHGRLYFFQTSPIYAYMNPKGSPFYVVCVKFSFLAKSVKIIKKENCIDTFSHFCTQWSRHHNKKPLKIPCIYIAHQGS